MNQPKQYFPFFNSNDPKSYNFHKFEGIFYKLSNKPATN